jgi:hypothetical protein
MPPHPRAETKNAEQRHALTRRVVSLWFLKGP